MTQKNNSPLLENNPINQERRYDIDALRVIATILLIYFHTAMIFNKWSVFHIKNDDLSIEAAIFVSFFNIWHMPLFFLLSGISTYYALDFRTGKQYAKERVKRLLLPLIFGIFIVVPPQVYYERLAWWSETRHSPINFNGSYFEFYPHFFEGIYPNGNFSWHHLWFIWYLFFISLIILPYFLKLKREEGKHTILKIANYFEEKRKIFLFAIPLIIVNVSLRWIFPQAHNFIFDWAVILHFLFIFIYGFIIISDSRFEISISRNKGLALILGVIIAIFSLTFDTIRYMSLNSNSSSFNAFFENPIILIITYLIGMTIWSFGMWCWLIAILGYARKYLNKPNSFISYASKISLPFYILHQTVIIIIGFYVIQWDTTILVKYIVISTAALFITVFLCELIKTNNILRFVFGMKLKKK